MPDFVNVTGSIGLLKEFVTFRDTSPLYDNVRGTGSIGFPLIELEDGTRTRDTAAVLKTLGIEYKKVSSTHQHPCPSILRGSFFFPTFHS